jgi:6-phosphogluconolactonase
LPRPEIVIQPDAQSVAETAARFVVAAVREAIAERGWCAVALSGGTTPRDLYRRLAGSPTREQIDWERVHLLWGDERVVPPDHPDSNYRMTREILLEHVPIPSSNIYRIPVELGAVAAAAQYEQTLQRVFGTDRGAIPEFDLILLGVGADGHTASLFPHTPALGAHDRLVTPSETPAAVVPRVTLTVPVLQAGRRVIVLVTGKDKAEAVARAIDGVEDIEETPAQLLRYAAGRVTWVLDRAAACHLRSAAACWDTD